MDMREQKFGIEIEMTGITRQRAAEVMAAYFSSAASYDGGSYEVYSVRDAAGRISTRHPMMQGHCGTSPTSCTARKI